VPIACNRGKAKEQMIFRPFDVSRPKQPDCTWLSASTCDDKTVMSRLKKILRLCLLLPGAGFFILVGQAAPVTFTIDNSQSTIFASGLFANFALTPQATGSSITSYSGSVNADLTGSTIQFTGGSLVNANTNGVWQPAAGGASGSAAADYGLQASVNLPPHGFYTFDCALRNLSLDVTSPVLTVGSGSFNGTNLIFSFASNNAVMDYYSSYKAGSVTLGGYATNAATGATLSVTGSVQTLTIPINATFVFTVLSANDSSVHLIGQIVATNVLTAAAVPIIQSFFISGQNVVVTTENTTAQSHLLVSTNLTAWSTASATLTTNGLGMIVFTSTAGGPRAFYRVQQ
jgi:hypothetical protein